MPVINIRIGSSGVQSFSGETWQEVAEKLGQAQLHATKQLRKLAQENAALRVKVGMPPKPKPNQPVS